MQQTEQNKNQNKHIYFPKDPRVIVGIFLIRPIRFYAKQLPFKNGFSLNKAAFFIFSQKQKTKIKKFRYL